MPPSPAFLVWWMAGLSVALVLWSLWCCYHIHWVSCKAVAAALYRHYLLLGIVQHTKCIRTHCCGVTLTLGIFSGLCNIGEEKRKAERPPLPFHPFVQTVVREHTLCPPFVLAMKRKSTAKVSGMNGKASLAMKGDRSQSAASHAAKQTVRRPDSKVSGEVTHSLYYYCILLYYCRSTHTPPLYK